MWRIVSGHRNGSREMVGCEGGARKNPEGALNKGETAQRVKPSNLPPQGHRVIALARAHGMWGLGTLTQPRTVSFSSLGLPHGNGLVGLCLNSKAIVKTPWFPGPEAMSPAVTLYLSQLCVSSRPEWPCLIYPSRR